MIILKFIWIRVKSMNRKQRRNSDRKEVKFNRYSHKDAKKRLQTIDLNAHCIICNEFLGNFKMQDKVMTNFVLICPMCQITEKPFIDSLRLYDICNLLDSEVIVIPTHNIHAYQMTLEYIRALQEFENFSENEGNIDDRQLA